jgi:nucleoside phosphorylase
MERAADWVQELIIKPDFPGRGAATYPMCALAFSLCILRWGQTHRVPERQFDRLVDRFRRFVIEGDYHEESVIDAGRELNTPYTLFTPVWSCYALLNEERPENHHYVLMLTRHILRLQRPGGLFARELTALAHDVYSTGQAVIVLKAVENYLESDLARDSSLLLNTGAIPPRVSSDLSADVCIVCAVDLELEKLLQVSRELDWKRLDITDTNDFHMARLSTSGGRSLRLVAAKAGRMGMTSAAALTTKMILRFSPRLVCMIGIAAGTRSRDRGYGDILVASPAFDYSSGKWRERGRLFWRKLYLDPDPQSVDIPEVLRNRIDSVKNEYLVRICEAWTGGALPNNPLRVHLGPVASGNAVVAAAPFAASIQRAWRKLVGIEMEIYGVYRAAHDTVSPPPLFVAFKSVCDFADSTKTDDWQGWAAFTSAMFAIQLLTHGVDDILG